MSIRFYKSGNATYHYLPVPDRLPYRGHHPRRQQSVEHTLQNQRDAHNVPSIHVDAHEAANGAAGGNEEHPDPFRPTTQECPPAISRQIPPAMLAHVDQGENNRKDKHEGKSQASRRMSTYIPNRCIAGGSVHESPILVHVWLELIEGKIAVRAIGKGPIAEERVVIVIECGAIEMDLVDEHIGGIGAGLKGNYSPHVQQRHRKPISRVK